jgi:hypothetical protein
MHPLRLAHVYGRNFVKALEIAEQKQVAYFQGATTGRQLFKVSLPVGLGLGLDVAINTGMFPTVLSSYVCTVAEHHMLETEL